MSTAQTIKYRDAAGRAKRSRLRRFQTRGPVLARQPASASVKESAAAAADTGAKSLRRGSNQGRLLAGVAILAAPPVLPLIDLRVERRICRLATVARSDETRVGKEWVSTCSSRWLRFLYKTKNSNIHINHPMCN